MATFASVAGIKLPENDRAGQPIIFDSFDISPVLFGTGKSPRTSWFYFTENELSPGAARVGNTRPCSTCVATTARQPAVWPSTRTRLERRGEIRRYDSPGVRPVGGPAGTLRHLHEQLTERTWTVVSIREESRS